VRLRVGECFGELRQVGHAGDLNAEQDREVQPGHAVGDVRCRQVRHDPVARLRREQHPHRVGLGDHVGVRQFHALRRAGGAGRVDDRREVGRFDGPPGRVEVEVGVPPGLEVRE
jgi:hypothetical protein